LCGLIQILFSGGYVGLTGEIIILKVLFVEKAEVDEQIRCEIPAGVSSMKIGPYWF
jgi:hypothetical protein